KSHYQGSQYAIDALETPTSNRKGPDHTGNLFSQQGSQYPIDALATPTGNRKRPFGSPDHSEDLSSPQERYVGIQFPKIHSTETPEDLSLDDPFSFHLSPLNLSPEEFPVDIEHDSHQVGSTPRGNQIFQNIPSGIQSFATPHSSKSLLLERLRQGRQQSGSNDGLGSTPQRNQASRNNPSAAEVVEIPHSSRRLLFEALRPGGQQSRDNVGVCE
ncbi:uncharacterized protein LOC142355689, partial [Convolutriloba macropyga]|uniref:uncharacterized protein LOC142355689 n=1 Tax=Convolutriloba macropyga TaxID=536237 RepID=UPI003F525D66